MSPEEFLTTLFDGMDGYLCLVETDGKGDWNRQRFYKYPDEHARAVEDATWSLERSFGYSPFLYDKPQRKGEVPGSTRVIALDADHHGPEEFRLEPSFVMETSPGSYHLVWFLDEVIDKNVAVNLGKRMRDVHGLEASATNTSKILRFPGSLNTDSEKVSGRTPHRVTAKATGAVYSVADIEEAYPGVDLVPVRSEVGVSDTLPDNLPTLFDAENKLPSHARLDWLMRWREVDQIGLEKDKRSERIHELCHLLLEQGLTPEEAVVVGWSAEPVREHYQDNGRTIEEFWRFDILKAVSQKSTDAGTVAVSPDPEPTAITPAVKEVKLLSAEERAFVRANPTWIDDWVEKCYTRLDQRTPRDYLVVFGYLLLASTLSSCGTGASGKERIDPNLYILNLGPTGTGKSKSLKFFKECLHAFEESAGYHIDIGNEASPEGLVAHLRDYDDRMATFIRDEVGGMFAEWVNRGYQVKAPELFMDLYDNAVPTRLLATKGAGNPNRVKLHAFNVYMTGTPEKVFRVLTEEFYESGFMQRLVPIFAEREEVTESAYKEAKWQGDPRNIEAADQLPYDIAGHLFDVAKTWKDKADRSVIFFEDDAWRRWVDFGWAMQRQVRHLDRGEHLAAVTERLAMSVLKMSVLLALEKLQGTVSLKELLPVIEHAETWVKNIIYMSSEIAESEHSRRVEEAVTLLRENKGKITLPRFYSYFRALRPRDADEVLISLRSRGLAAQKSDDRGVEWLLAAGVSLDRSKRSD